jgi:hypothetical protein
MSDSDTEAFKVLVIVALGLLALVAYLLPTLIAFFRRHHYRWIICAINIVTGATGVGYFVALVWAIWPRRTGLADPFINDPTSNSMAESRTIYRRYGANVRAFHDAQTNMQIFVLQRGQRHGPYTAVEVRSLLLSGSLSLTDFAWHEGLTHWIMLSAIPEVNAEAP